MRPLIFEVPVYLWNISEEIGVSDKDALFSLLKVQRFEPGK